MSRRTLPYQLHLRHNTGSAVSDVNVCSTLVHFYYWNSNKHHYYQSEHDYETQRGIISHHRHLLQPIQ